MSETPRSVVVMAQFGLEDYKQQLVSTQSMIKIHVLQLEKYKELENELKNTIEELEQFLKKETFPTVEQILENENG